MIDDSLKTIQFRYKYLAFITIRDALGFYLGIPLFLDDNNLRHVLNKALNEKMSEYKKDKNRELTPKEINKCFRSVRRSLNLRIKELEEDLVYCERILFHDNLWLQHLNLNETFFKHFLDKLNSDTKRSLAVIPKWGTRDHSLGRTYINDNFNVPQIFE